MGFGNNLPTKITGFPDLKIRGGGTTRTIHNK